MERLEHAPKAGEIFAGKYRVDRVLGVGGMGYVLAATHLQLHERVAIKMLLPAMAADPDTVQRFLREGRAAVKIRSEHCVRVQDVGALPDNTPYMVMEYLEGHDLSDVLKQRGKLPPSVAVDYVLEACEAIAEAHGLHIVHRDLKPANLFLQRLGNGSELVKVLDFGISKMAGQAEGNMSMTRTSAMMGSPLYMSPEQLKSSKNVDARADQWALGVILYELIAGAVPFNADTMAELGALVLSGETPWLGTAAPGTPPELCSIVATCLRRKPDDRFTNLADLADAIAPFGTQRARDSANAIVKTLGIPSMRAHRVSFGSIDVQGRTSEPSMPAISVEWGVSGATPPPNWGGSTPAPPPSHSSPRAVTLADSSGAQPAPARHVRWPLLLVPALLLALGGVGAAAAIKWRAQRPAMNGPAASSSVSPEVAQSAASIPTSVATSVLSAVVASATLPAQSASVSMASAAVAQRKVPPRTAPSAAGAAAAAITAALVVVPSAKPVPNPEHATSPKD